MLKNILALSLAVIMFVLAGCGAQSSTTPVSSAPSGAASEAGANMSDVSLVFASDAVGSGSYNIIVEMSKVLENEGGFGLIDVQPVNPGGMGAPYLFADKNIAMAFVNGAPAKWAREEGTLGKPPAENNYLAVIGGLTAVCYINCVSNDFLKKYNVSTIEEIFEQKLPLRIGCSPVGSMDAQGAYLLFERFGVTEAEFKAWGGSITNQSGSENQAAIQDGKIDFYIDHTSSSSSTMAEIATTCDVTFLQWGDETVDWFIKEKGFQRVAVPANSFKGQDKELVLPGSPDCIFAQKDLDEEVVYQFTKTLSENHDKLVATYNSLAPWDVKTAWESEKIGGAELHPGAARYYKEMGYMK